MQDETKQGYEVEVINAGDERVYSDEGVDLSLIRWMLSLSPTERLKHLQNSVNMIRRLQRAKPRN